MSIHEFICLIYSDSYIKKIESRVKLFGFKDKINVDKLLFTRLVLLILIMGVILCTVKNGYIIAPIVGFIFYILFDYIVIKRKIKKRQIALEKEAMHFFEVLTLSIDAGRNLSEALDVTVNNVTGELNDEFKEAIREVTFGKSLSEALFDMQQRIPSETINNVVLSLTQSNLLGTSVIDNLYQQIDYLREKRKLEVKGRISRVPILISVISVLFFIPLLFIIILGPIILEYL